MKLAEKRIIRKRFIKINPETFRISDVIGQGKYNIPREALLNATPEVLIKNPYDLTSCLQAITSVHTTGEPMTLKLAITINAQTTLETIHFKRADRHTDPQNTIIAFTIRH